jgi:hypothetical protein
MASPIVESAMFFLVLFVLFPAMIIFAMLMRDVIYQNHKHKHAGWQK